MTLSRPFGRTSRGFITLRTERVSTDVDTSTNPTLAAISQNGSVSSGTFRFTHSSRDSEIEPFTGKYTSYAVEVGKADFDSQTADSGNTLFTKYSIDLRGYFSKGGPRKDLNERRAVPAVRLQVGSLAGNVPFFEQYFIGGAETLRGYREDRFWGRNMFLVNTEYRFPLAPSLNGVAFLDLGDAWGTPSQFLNVFASENLLQHEGLSPRVGYGLGIRVITPIGPLRLDYGFGDEGSRAHFSIGHVF